MFVCLSFSLFGRCFGLLVCSSLPNSACPGDQFVSLYRNSDILAVTSAVLNSAPVWCMDLDPICGVSWFRRFVAGLFLRRPIFNPSPVSVGFIVSKLVLGKASVRLCHFTTSALSFMHHRRYMISAVFDILKYNT
jgi:hypothetical protein